MFTLIEILLGLFVWLALPPLLLKKKKRKPYKRFITVVCKIFGIMIIAYAVWEVLKCYFKTFVK
jgi:hypothetical protein